MWTTDLQSKVADPAGGELISVEQVCHLLSIARSTLQRWRVENPEFPRPVSIGPNTIRFHRRELTEWLHNRERA